MKICPKCQKENDDNNIFCTNCSTALEPINENISTNTNKENNTVSENKTKISPILFYILEIVFIAMLVFSFNKENVLLFFLFFWLTLITPIITKYLYSKNKKVNNISDGILKIIGIVIAIIIIFILFIIVFINGLTNTIG